LIYSSWRNQVECFFARTTDKTARRGPLTGVNQLMQRIGQLDTYHNAKSRPFRWSAATDAILENLQFLCSRISGTEHWARSDRKSPWPIGSWLFSRNAWGGYAVLRLQGSQICIGLMCFSSR
jgi:hypothetical protein